MIKWLLKNTAEFRLETMTDVEDFHKQLQKACENEDFTLTSFSWAEKTAKNGDEIEEYFVVKYVYTFNNAKDPSFPWNGVEFTKANTSDLAQMEQGEW